MISGSARFRTHRFKPLQSHEEESMEKSSYIRHTNAIRRFEWLLFTTLFLLFIGQGVDLSLYGGLEPYHLLLLGTFWQFGYLWRMRQGRNHRIISQSLWRGIRKVLVFWLFAFLYVVAEIVGVFRSGETALALEKFITLGPCLLLSLLVLFYIGHRNPLSPIDERARRILITVGLCGIVLVLINTIGYFGFGAGVYRTSVNIDQDVFRLPSLFLLAYASWLSWVLMLDLDKEFWFRIIAIALSTLLFLPPILLVGSVLHRLLAMALFIGFSSYMIFAQVLPVTLKSRHLMVRWTLPTLVCIALSFFMASGVASLVNDGLIEKYNREHREYVFYPDRYPNGFAEETPTENLLSIDVSVLQDVFSPAIEKEQTLWQRVVGKGGSQYLLEGRGEGDHLQRRGFLWIDSVNGGAVKVAITLGVVLSAIAYTLKLLLMKSVGFFPSCAILVGLVILQMGNSSHGLLADPASWLLVWILTVFLEVEDFKAMREKIAKLREERYPIQRGN